MAFVMGTEIAAFALADVERRGVRWAAAAAELVVSGRHVGQLDVMRAASQCGVLAEHELIEGLP